jgi:hypothetical protein
VNFRLRVNNRDYHLSPDQPFRVGRTPESELILDDPLVSRNHAVMRMRGEALELEDLESRNGVRVNGAKIGGIRSLIHGDIVEIGKQQILVIARTDSLQTLNQPATERFQSFAVISPLVDKVLALGKGGEAEKLVSARLESILEDATKLGTLDAGLLQEASLLSLKLAAGTGNARWLDYVIRLYAAVTVICPADVVDQLYEVVHRVRQVDLTALDEYVGLFRGRLTELGPNERFLLGRLEGLGRVAAAR